jgi:LmbE family N-acetylglucosaminyl deacetylase
VTFGPDGVYGHPDHIAISQFTSAAVVRAGDGLFALDNLAPHWVSKLYYVIDSQPLVDVIREVLGGIGMMVDGVMRRHVGWEDWAITTRVDVRDYWQQAWQASRCHQTQLPGLGPLAHLPEDALRRIFGDQGTFYRAFSLVNGGRAVETDLFAGLR